jgi:membrane protease YdiL (CAAX protease family)
MLMRILITWFVANFVIAGLASWLAGGWYLGWDVSPTAGMLAELGLIILPNLLLPMLVLRFWWPEPIPSIRQALGWRWTGWRSLLTGGIAFLVVFLLLRAVVALTGESIPYQLPEAGGEGIALHGLGEIIAVLLGLAGFVTLTVAGEETMFRGWIQTQLGERYGVWIGLLAGMVLFGLRHLPADLFYARAWQATPQMWLSRQLQLYLLALFLGLARHFGKSTYASAIAHALILVVALLGLG